MKATSSLKSRRSQAVPRRDKWSTGGEARTFRYCDALDLPAAGSFADLASSVGVSVEAPGKPRRYVRHVPEFHIDPDDVGLFSGFTHDEIISPPPFVVYARNARVVGFRTILSEDGVFFNDDSIRDRAQQKQFLRLLAMPYPFSEETGLEPAGTGEDFTLNLGTRAIKRIPGTTIVLGSAEPSNYGSWLFRILPKFQSLRASASIRKRRPRYLVWCDIPVFREYLELLQVTEDRIVHHDTQSIVYELERAVIPSMRNNQAFIDPESAELFAELRSRFGGSPKKGRRIYVSRVSQTRSGNSRAMLNEPELVKRLRKMRFRIVNPETLSAIEQISVFSSAEMVVGPAGSGMFNIVFCHPGTKVIDIESEPHWIHAHRSLFASCGMRFGIFVGKTIDRNFEEHHRPWEVNIDALIAQIEAWTRKDS